MIEDKDEDAEMDDDSEGGGIGGFCDRLPSCLTREDGDRSNEVLLLGSLSELLLEWLLLRRRLLRDRRSSTL